VSFTDAYIDWMPLCTSRNAYSADLVNYVRLHRLSSNTGGLASVLTHLHYLRYLQLKRRYISTLEVGRPACDAFGSIDDAQGYRDYDRDTLKQKCSEIESKLPKYLEHWLDQESKGIEHGYDKFGAEYLVQDKIAYWKHHDPRVPEARSKQNQDHCKRCLLSRNRADQHPKTSCLDGVLVSRLDIPYPQPERLFLNPKGCLDKQRFSELSIQLGRLPPQTLPMHNFDKLRILLWDRSKTNIC